MHDTRYMRRDFNLMPISIEIITILVMFTLENK